ncbi:hypothetical protein [Nocardioides sp.]|uniref:hypothetical protein n=1 Tax=Nocardioides sp. TaxID=35761 RepID=UPI002BC1A3AD|nr:hypothetical protein [Nocardioides sp.]HXH77365.1 hypothetical protein [Nocardioides sp.]
MSARLRGSLVLLLAGVLTACAGSGDPGSSDGPKAVPELERQWEMSSLGTIPQSWNEHSWLSDSSYKNPTESGGGTLRLFDAQSGEQVTFSVGGYECGGTSLALGDTHFTLVTTDEVPEDDYGPVGSSYMYPGDAPDCSGLTVYDASTGRTAWEVPVGTGPSILDTSINGNAVIVSYDDHDQACFNREDGSPLSVADDADCAGPEPLPRITDEQGGRVRERRDRIEIAELDGVVLVTEYTRSPLVRAYDRETGRTLWVNEVDPDPTGDQTWTRTETYASTSDSLLHIRYEFEEQEGKDSLPVPTFAFISRVDPRTGEELGPVGKVAGGLFLAQVGDIAVMGVDQEDGLDAQLAGFRIPAADG